MMRRDAGLTITRPSNLRPQPSAARMAVRAIQATRQLASLATAASVGVSLCKLIDARPVVFEHRS